MLYEVITEISDAIAAWNGENTVKFSDFVGADAVKRSLLPNQSEKDIFDRSNLAGTLIAEVPGLTGIRIIDAGDPNVPESDDTGKRRIHFSTFDADILSKQDFQISYENYGAKEGEIPFKRIARKDGDS